MIPYNISEHLGRRSKDLWVVAAPDPESALRISTMPPFKPLMHAHEWPFIDDGLEGGALVDPADEDHCIRADPRVLGGFKMTYEVGRQRNKIKPEFWEELKRMVEDAKIKPRKTIEEIEAERGVKLWGYVRCSHQDSIKSGLGLDAQHRLIIREAEYVKEQYPELPDVDWLEEDEAISAYKVNLKDRPKGKILHRSLRKGDHVIFAYLDRAWRNTEDCLTTIRLWKERGVTVHFANQHIDTSTVMGELVLTIMAACAKMDSQMKSERNKEVCRGFPAKGRLNNGHAPMGFKLAGKSGINRVAIPDPEQRALWARLCVSVNYTNGPGWILAII